MKLRICLIKLIDFYQNKISPFKRGSCVFYPTCSQFAKDAVNKYGVLKGIRLFALRILRCHPWQNNHFDPVP